MNIGYGRNEMAEAIAKQALKLPFYNTFVDTRNPPAAELAAKVARLAPGDLDHVFFTTSGSESNDTAGRLIHFYNARRGKPHKKHMIARKDGYHGSTYIAMSLTGKILELGPENVAAFFAEPICGAGGVIVPPPGYHARVAEVCRRHDVLLVSDEVVTGFGRVGAMFASKDVSASSPTSSCAPWASRRATSRSAPQFTPAASTR